MRCEGSTGITAITLLSVILLASGSLLCMSVNQEDEAWSGFENKIGEILDEITSYFLVKEGYVKLEGDDMKVILLVKPVFKDSISISNLSIQVTDGKSIHILRLHDIVDVEKKIFEDPFWNNLDQEFSIIPVIDVDNSISKDRMTNGDIFYIAFKLEDADLENEIEVSIISEQGSISSFAFVVPFSISDIIKIY